MFGYLSERDIDHIFQAGSTFPEDVAWAHQRNNRNWVQFGGYLDSRLDTSLRINMAVSLLRPEKYAVVLLRGDQPLRRLCVRGSHQNPASVSGEVWKRRTHKHRWSDDLADKVAYTPADIPAGHFSAKEYERVFRAFCRECGVSFTGRWIDPPAHIQQRLDF